MNIQRLNLNSDADRAEFIIEASMIFANIAKETGINISIICPPDGSVTSDFGEYTYSKYDECGEHLEYRPKGKLHEWKHVNPDQINFGGKPCSKDT